jgi:hypothetical protein
MQETPLDEMQKYLHGVVYPSKRELVLQTAERNGAPANVLQRLSALKSRVSGPHEVLIVLREGGWTVRDTDIRQTAPQ